VPGFAHKVGTLLPRLLLARQTTGDTSRFAIGSQGFEFPDAVAGRRRWHWHEIDEVRRIEEGTLVIRRATLGVRRRHFLFRDADQRVDASLGAQACLIPARWFGDSDEAATFHDHLATRVVNRPADAVLPVAVVQQGATGVAASRVPLSSGPTRVEGDVTLADYHRTIVAMVEQQGAATARMAAKMARHPYQVSGLCALVACMCVIAAIANRDPDAMSGWSWAAFAMAALSAVYAAYIPAAMLWLPKRRGALGRHSYEVRDDALYETAPSKTDSLQWKRATVWRDLDYIHVVTKHVLGTRAGSLPRRFFDSEEDFDGFFERCAAAAVAAGGKVRR